jgi:hypothetical protein
MIAPLIPESLVYFLYNHFPSRALQKYRDTRVLFEGFSKSFLASKTEELKQGRNNRDVMSLMGHASPAYVGFLMLISHGI